MQLDGRVHASIAVLAAASAPAVFSIMPDCTAPQAATEPRTEFEGLPVTSVEVRRRNENYYGLQSSSFALPGNARSLKIVFLLQTHDLF